MKTEKAWICTTEIDGVEYYYAQDDEYEHEPFLSTTLILAMLFFKKEFAESAAQSTTGAYHFDQKNSFVDLDSFEENLNWEIREIEIKLL